MGKLFKNFVGIDSCKTWFDAALIKADDSSVVIHGPLGKTKAQLLAVVFFSFQSADGCLSLATRLLFVIPVVINKNKKTMKLTKKVISWLSDPTNSVSG